MKQLKKLLALFLALTCLLPALSTPALAAASRFETNLAGFEDKDAYRKTANGLYAEASGQGDQFAYSTTSGKDFVYEADVSFGDPSEDGAASLIFRNNGEGGMYVANLNGKTGTARVFKFGDKTDGAVDMGPAGSVNVKESGTYHLKVVAIGTHIVYYVDDQVVVNSADYTVGGWNHGQDDAYLEGTFGLMTWNTNVTYQNVNYTKITDANSPELSRLSVASSGGKVDKQISFHEGQYVYITYVSNSTKAISLDYAQKGSGGTVTVTNEAGQTVDSKKLPITKEFETFTLTSKVGSAQVVYRLRVHRCQPDEMYYNEDWRGQFHYSVKDGWGNDPNGMVYFNGVYHLFYQYFDGVTWGTMHWAHATSKDLIHWEEHPIEFYPDEYGSMFSGCAVVADHATAPAIFAEGETGIVFLITANGANGHDDQKIILAYSRDGETFEKYKDGQVVLHWREDPLDNGAFRDPKVFRYEGKWFMVIAGGPLRIYSSDDLVNWTVESAYADLNTECPDLYPLTVKDENGADTGEVKWVLDRGGRRYKIGDLKQVDGKWSFVPLEQYASPNAGGMGNEDKDGFMNFGHDSYAAMTYYLADAGVENSFAGKRVIETNWMNTWGYGFCNSIPSATGNEVFNGIYNLFLELGVKKSTDGKYYLTQTPIQEYETLRDTGKKIELTNAAISLDNDLLADFSGDSYEIAATIQPNTSKEIGFKVRVGADQETVIKYEVESGSLVIDRSRSGVIVASDISANVVSQAAGKNADGSVTFHIYVDRACVEVFNGDYTVAGAMQIFPSPAGNGLSVYSDDGSATGSITVYPLRTIWTDKVIPEGPIAIMLNKNLVTCYAGDSFTLDSWLSPGDVAQEVVYTVTAGSDVVSLTQNGLKAEVTALKTGTATIRIAAKNKPELTKDCVVKVTANNFKTNLKGFEVRSGTWFVDDVDYIGSHNDNAFLYSDFINSDHYTYEVDTQFESGILNFIFQAQSKNPYTGCYALQINDGKVRLFDFKGDRTFVETEPHALPKAESYHVEIQVEGQKIVAKINDIEYINTTITDPEHQYKAGYAALGLFFAEARYQNFYVNAEEREDRFHTNLTGFEIVDGAWYVDGEDYIGAYTGNAFLYSDFIDSDQYTYEVDTQCSGGVLNYIFQSQTKNPFDGCYSLQINPDGRVRLFDFKGDKTFVETEPGALPKAESYHVEIQVDGQKITAKINDTGFIDTAITDPERQYDAGYVGLGLYNTEARYQNFTVTGESPFADVVKGEFYYDAVLWAAKKGIVPGADAAGEAFRPEASCTRGELMAFLWYADGAPEVSGTVQFTDVSRDASYYDAVAWAVEKGVVTGTGGQFSPDETVTRGEAVTALYRYAGSPTMSSGGSFADVPADQDYTDAVAWAVAEDMTNGTSATTFSPASPCTRGQIVTFLYRLLAE